MSEVIEIDGMEFVEKKYKDFCYDKKETIAIRIYRDFLNVSYTAVDDMNAWSPMRWWKDKIDEFCFSHPLYRTMEINSRSIFDILYKDNKLFKRSPKGYYGDDKYYTYDIINSSTYGEKYEEHE